MIPKEIQAMFDFIDFLDANKKEYINVYLPLCAELETLDKERRSLRPNENYKQKLQYDAVQKQIEEKFPLVYENVYKPIMENLQTQNIWSGDNTYASIWNNNFSAIVSFKNNFSSEDISDVLEYKAKYLSFRKDTDSNFLTLQLVFSSLDEVLKELFDFFKDTDENEFESFESESVQCGSIEEALHLYSENPKKSIRFTLPDIFLNPNTTPIERETESKHILEELSTLKSLVATLLNTSKNKEAHSSYEEALYRIGLLKSVIEDKGGFKTFKIQENQNEAMFQLLFQFVKEGSDWDINTEVNNGRGPVDFTVSKGSQDKTVIEFKLAKSSSLKRNLQHQVEVYKKANNTNRAVVAILYFSPEEYQQVLKILKELNLFDLENVILIDGQQKASASNVKI
ncbi:MAG: hypothetical protein LBE37_16785 [Sphingobacterium sp.]|jgi:hypothetical protein|nr:hypothetical protein [Sphingobacterium sp.]